MLQQQTQCVHACIRVEVLISKHLTTGYLRTPNVNC